MKRLTLIISMLTVIACGDTQRSTEKFYEEINTIDSNFEENTNLLWQEMRLSHYNELQKGCEPVKLESNKNVSQKGLVILLHGFSACPQQYDQLAPRLANAGYDVLIPLYPGHGIVPVQLSPRLDNTNMVPKTIAAWKSFRNDINKLSKSYNGKRSLVGLSMGTNIALSAYIKEPEIYTNVVGVSPKLRNETSLLHGIFNNNLHILNIDEWILSKKSGWSSCIEDSALELNPRSGFCNFENRNAVAMLGFGNETIKDSKTLSNGSNTKVQLILSHNDDGIANNGAFKLAENLKAGGVNLSLCTMPKPVPHSMFSPYDRPSEKPWLSFLFTSIEESLISSIEVPTAIDDPNSCDWKL